MDTDGAPIKVVAQELLLCINNWEPTVRLLGNIRASDISRLCQHIIDTTTSTIDLEKSASKFKELIDNLTPEDIEKYFPEDKTPKGWVSIEDHLPMCTVGDFVGKGYTEYSVKNAAGVQGFSEVCDHSVWYYNAKEMGITHWWNGTQEELKTENMKNSEGKPKWNTLLSIIEQLDACEYQTEDGLHSLVNNAAYVALKKIAQEEAQKTLRTEDHYAPIFVSEVGIVFIKNPVLNSFGGANIEHRQILKSAAGYYIGTLSKEKFGLDNNNTGNNNQMMDLWTPDSRDSQDYWDLREDAEQALIKNDYRPKL